MAKKTDKEIVDLPIAKLKSHPRNAKLYSNRPEWQIEELAEDMRKNGQTEPLEVTPNRVIICGHGRVEAAKVLGWEKLKCWVRHDLAEAGPEAVEARLTEANLSRRHLTKLDLVRSYQLLKTLGRDKHGRRLSENKARGDFRDLIGKRFGVSGRTLDRWEQVLGLPMALQATIDSGDLQFTQAVKVAGLPPKVQAQIVEEIATGKPVKEVVKRHLGKAPVKRVQGSTLMKQLLSSLKRARKDFAGRTKELTWVTYSTDLGELSEGKKLLEALIGRIKGTREHCENAKKTEGKETRRMSEEGDEEE